MTTASTDETFEIRGWCRPTSFVGVGMLSNPIPRGKRTKSGCHTCIRGIDGEGGSKTLRGQGRVTPKNHERHAFFPACGVNASRGF